jgi:hypothetical protein
MSDFYSFPEYSLILDITCVNYSCCFLMTRRTTVRQSGQIAVTTSAAVAVTRSDIFILLFGDIFWILGKFNLVTCREYP